MPAGEVAQFTQAWPKSPQVPLPTVAHVPALQQEVWQVPSPAPPQLPLHMPLAPHVGVWPPHGVHAPPQWSLSYATHVPLEQQPPLQGLWPAPPQEGPHTLFGWQAFGAGQSGGPLQPQLPLTQAVPLGEAVQSAQWPGEPQLVGVFAQGPSVGGADSGVASAGTTVSSATSGCASSAGSDGLSGVVVSGSASRVGAAASCAVSRPAVLSPHAATSAATARYPRAAARVILTVQGCWLLPRLSRTQRNAPA